MRRVKTSSARSWADVRFSEANLPELFYSRMNSPSTQFAANFGFNPCLDPVVVVCNGCFADKSNSYDPEPDALVDLGDRSRKLVSHNLILREFQFWRFFRL